jgi:putative transposase
MKIEYNNLYTHFIFITLNRLPTIPEKNRQRIEKYMTGIVSNNDSKLYAIYANPEHVHFLVSRSPKLSEEDLATIIADSTERFINENKLCVGRFVWQVSAAAFSVSKSDVDRVCKYILNQHRHHHKETFMEEYESFMKFYQKTLNPKNKVIRLTS